MKERIRFWDIARGLAVLLVIFYHVPLYIRICHPSAAALVEPHVYAGTYIRPFFMPVFFIISGYFTSTDKPYKQFLWGDVIHLLFTTLLLQLLNALIQTVGLGTLDPLKWWCKTLFSIRFLDIIFSQWFISAIFFARQLFYGIDHLTQLIARSKLIKQRILEGIILFVLCLACIFVEPYAPFTNKWFYIQGAFFTIFIYFGRLLHDVTLPRWTLPTLGGGYILLMALCKWINRSTLEYGMLNPSFVPRHLFLYLALALSGSALTIVIAKGIHHCKPLEFIGKHSLVFYIPQGGILYVTATQLAQWIQPDCPMHIWLYIIIMWATCLIGLTLISLLEDVIKEKWR